uniref:N-acetyltransferase domain-containing protein n=1 Tax=Monopterus albus TaxID=43700 RepID=A0A3Q3K7K2_MONAL
STVNAILVLYGNKVVLVPYNANHVTRYHEWMKCPELQHPTASEPLTLEQEYNMQESWREDDDNKTSSAADPSIEEEQCTVGDVNMFLADPTDLSSAELEIMIAEPSYRGKGIGKVVTHVMMHYSEHLIPGCTLPSPGNRVKAGYTPDRSPIHRRT